MKSLIQRATNGRIPWDSIWRMRTRKHFRWEIQKNGYGKPFESGEKNGFVFRIPEQSENKSEVNTEEKNKRNKGREKDV